MATLHFQWVEFKDEAFLRVGNQSCHVAHAYKANGRAKWWGGTCTLPGTVVPMPPYAPKAEMLEALEAMARAWLQAACASDIIEPSREGA